MKKMLLLAAIVISFGSCAQMNKSIVKAEAFYVIPTQGTIPVDDAGQPIAIQRNKVYQVFLEVKENSLEWTKAWADDKFYNLIPVIVKDNTALAGNTKLGHEKIVVKASQGNALVQLELSPNETRVAPPQTVNQGELLLEGKWKGKPFYYKITKIIELASPQYQ